MKAIIIAAGMGRRLRPHTDDRPKCMVEIAGKPILHHQLDALRAHGIDDVVIIRGYMGRGIQAKGVRFVDNHRHRENNILESLFCAGPELVGDVIVSYGDILYRPSVVGRLLGHAQPGVLVVDTAWRQIYQGRTDHPESEAELLRLSPYELVTEVGKQVSSEGAVGEFIGLARLTSGLVGRLWALYQEARLGGRERPYGNAPTLRQAYMTDLFNDAIRHGEQFGVCPIAGDWREIDTVQDYQRAQKEWK
ncbi:MAG: phosphocholine cytidylyltransferase family protein [bacterium]